MKLSERVDFCGIFHGFNKLLSLHLFNIDLNTELLKMNAFIREKVFKVTILSLSTMLSWFKIQELNNIISIINKKRKEKTMDNSYVCSSEELTHFATLGLFCFILFWECMLSCTESVRLLRKCPVIGGRYRFTVYALTYRKGWLWNNLFSI